MTARATPGSTVLGYPRIGPNRELKRVLEGYWSGSSGAAELDAVGAELRRDTWRELDGAGLDSVPSNTFSYYDHVLDAARVVGAVPERFTELGLDPVDTLFAMARGHGNVPALELTKFFDTNYHYLVPELGPGARFALVDRKPVEEFTEALDLGIPTRPVLLGPVTFLLLAKPAPGAPGGFTPLELLDPLLEVYAELLGDLAAAGAQWVQMDEPAFAADRTPDELDALRRAYGDLGRRSDRPALLIAGYFGDLGPALPVLAQAPVEALALDLVAGAADIQEMASLPGLHDKTVLAGVIDGRNVWRTDLDTALARATALRSLVGQVEIATSCSLLYVPYDVEVETGLAPAVRRQLAFARQKIHEVVLLSRALRKGRAAVAAQFVQARAQRVAGRGMSKLDNRAQAQLARPGPVHSYRRGPAEQRAATQRSCLRLPTLPTTTIGSFPQTAAIRAQRAAYRAGQLDAAEYQQRMHAEIQRVIRLQEDIGLDVLVHGEPERNDMVQYFAEHLAGFATTEFGWVQAYGSRCVRPPVLYANVSRPEPITVGWSTYAQSLTTRPVKAMLTGPVTMLAWSFVRDDQPLAQTARQVALALREEVCDLEAAGLRVIQVDEPALRELLPLRAHARLTYLDWAVEAFQLVVGGVTDSTQVHTHLCYSQFADVIEAINALDADVTTVEAARSKMEILELLGAGVPRALGPGVYDVHSPEIPDIADIEELLVAAQRWVNRERLWVNPDCGLKTRGEAEVVATLRNLVAATRRVRTGAASRSS